MQEVLCARFFALRRRCWALDGGVAGAVMPLDMPSGWPFRQFSFNGNFDPIPGFNGNWEISESQDWRGFAHVAIPAFSGKRHFTEIRICGWRQIRGTAFVSLLTCAHARSCLCASADSRACVSVVSCASGDAVRRLRSFEERGRP